jgi:DNA-binding MarR family transcriptional regulator
MQPTLTTQTPVADELSKLRQANVEAKTLLREATRQLDELLQDEAFRTETPVETEAVIEGAFRSLRAALHCLESAAPSQRSSAAQLPGAPTRQQGQFLAFIREYLLRNESGVAPSHADFQRFFNLTPPSVNSMLIRLQQRGFIRRIPHQARAIELTISAERIPPLDRPFRF